MNKVHRVIWSRIRQCYVVVSEVAGTHSRRGGSAGRRALMAAVLAAAAVTGGVVPGMTVYAVPSPDDPAPAHDYRLVENPDANSGGKYTVDKDGKFHLKVKDDASGDMKSIELNGVAVVYGGNKVLKSTDAAGAINEVNWNSATRDTTSSITLGKDTLVSVQGGYSEKSFLGITIKKPSKGESILFGDTKHTGGIAIGENVKSLNSSTVLGINGYKGKIGNVDLATYNPKEPLGVASTSVGSNSFVSGTFSSNVGAYNISSTDYLNTDRNPLNAFQNFGSVMVGSLNSIESYGTNQMISGNSNGLIGIANKAQNSNGSLIFGTGNEITNSIKDIGSFSGIFEVPESAAFAADAVREAVQSGKAGGAVLAVGGGNKADHTTMSQLLGVQNIVNGSTLTMTTGYMNTVENSNNVSVIGTQNTVSGDSNVVIGDRHSVQGKNNVVLGSADTLTEMAANGVVVLGHKANVHVNGGVALGENSLASVAAGKVGYLGAAGTDDAVWKSKAAAVSVGAAGMTRQITHVAAGTEDTDAVNVAQLRKVWRDLYNQIVSPVTPSAAPGDGSGSGTGSTETTPKPIHPDTGREGTAYKSDFQLVNGKTDAVIGNDGKAMAIQKGNTKISTGYKADSNGNITMEVKDANGHTNYVAITDVASNQKLNQVETRLNDNTKSISILNGSLSRLDRRVDRVGAGAAALAALHPLDFDPDAKWDFAAGYGNYNGANAVSVGAYYRPNEDVMLSVGGSMGGGENMVNAGISLKIGTGASHVNNSKVAMAKEIKDLRKELEDLKSMMRDSHAGRAIDTSKLQLFPDVPQNHWAYAYVAQLAGNGIIKGYPDGTFGGSRPMTRYEFAAMLYRAMTNGAVLSDRILNEFAPELERFTVDTVHTDKDGNPTVERVRVVKK